MYAAAGGASLASRQARMRQRQQKKNQQLQAKLHPPKAPGLAGSDQGASTPTRQSKQFHQLPSNYLRAAQPHGRKLSASYTAQSKLLLPIDEGDTQSMLRIRMHSHAHIQPMHHSHAHGSLTHQARKAPDGVEVGATSMGVAATPGHYQYFAAAAANHGRASPKLTHRHSGSSSTSIQQSSMPKSATATLPLVSQVEATPPTTPSGPTGAKLGVGDHKQHMHVQSAHISLPGYHDNIIVTPATPMASPGHVAKIRDTDELATSATETQPLTASNDDDDEIIQPPTAPLDRKCSVYRMRRIDTPDLQFSNHEQQYEPLSIDEPPIIMKGHTNGRKWQQCAYCEEGICVCEHIECAQGRAAWLERGRRCSVQEQSQQASCRRWVKRNRIQDASLAGSSDDEDFLGVLRGPSTFANSFLYVGLGTIALGLVIAFVGTGEKGFKTVELRLIGPSLIVLGLICCVLRIFFCICPSHCISSNRKRTKNGNKIDADYTTALLRGESKRVSISRTSQPKYPIAHKRHSNRMLNDGMDALRQLATTSLFIQNEQKLSLNRVVPIIREPESRIEAPLEMRKMDSELKPIDKTNSNTESTNNAADNEFIASKSLIVEGESGSSASAIASAIASAGTSGAAEEKLELEKRASDNLEETSKSTLLASSGEQQTTANSNKYNVQREKEAKTSRHPISATTAWESISGETETDTTATATTGAAGGPFFNTNLSTELKLERPLLSSFNEDPTSSRMSSNGTARGAIAKKPAKDTDEIKLSIDQASSLIASDATFRSPTLPKSTSLSSSDVPPRLPHSYSSTLRSDQKIRGPLGMPISDLRAMATLSSTSGSYLSSTSSIKPTSTTETTAINLLSMPSVISSTSKSSSTSAGRDGYDQYCIPGQVLEASFIRKPLIDSLNSPKSFLEGASRETATTSSSCISSIAQSSTDMRGTASGLMKADYPKSDIYELPLKPMMPSASPFWTQPVYQDSSITSIDSRTKISASLTPSTTQQLTPTANKAEPELLLSPAKLGQ